jgi:hypothetical protein
MLPIARHGVFAALTTLCIAAAGCGGDDNGSASDQSQATTTAADEQAALDKSKFTTKVTHPLVPLASVPFTAFRGTDTGSKTRGTNQLLKRTTVVAGVGVAILENKEYEDGKLVEHTFDYFAQRRSDGSVWYFGERVQNFENGKVNHEGQWLAGKGKNKPGIYMPAKPKVGQVFQQERAPGVAEDRSTILASGITRKTGAGTFKDCIKVKDYSPIDKLSEFKYYCPGVGLVHEDEPHAHSDLVKYRRAK